MTGVLILAILCAAPLLAWHMWLSFHFGVPYSTACACGHAAAFHKGGGGCRHTHDGSTDCYGYCTCQRSAAEVEERLAEGSDR